MGHLSHKQRLFAHEYLICWNATQAALRAGYSVRTARVIGPANLKKPAIAAAIEAVINERLMARDEVLLRLAEQARGEQTAYIRKDGTVNLAAMIADGKAHLIKGTKWDRLGHLTVEFYDAQRALELIGKHHALFCEVQEHKGQVKVVHEFDLSKLTDEELDRLARIAERLAGNPTGAGAPELPPVAE